MIQKNISPKIGRKLALLTQITASEAETLFL
jgi:hypothetical protein